ncbi:M60 family metallopeptidase [Enterobacter cloacae]
MKVSETATGCLTTCLFEHMPNKKLANGPILENVMAKMNDDGTFFLQGNGSPDGAVVYLHAPGSNEWRGVASIEQGAFVNESIYDSYVEDERVMTLRAEFDNSVSVPLIVRMTPVAKNIVAVRTKSGEIAVGGVVTPVDTVVYAESQSEGKRDIASVTTDGRFINASLTSSYLWDNDTMRLWFHNAQAINGPVNVPVMDSVPVLTSFSAYKKENGNIRAEAICEDWPDNALIYSQTQRDGESVWLPVGDVIGGKVSLSDVPASYLWNDTTLRLKVGDQALGIESSPVDATLGWPQSRAFFVKATVQKKEEQTRLQHYLQLADYQPTGYFAPKGVPFTVELAPCVSPFDVEMCIGTPNLADRDNLDGSSPMPRWHTLKPGRNEIPGDEFGGIIHFRHVLVLHDKSQPDAHVTLGEGALPIPYYLNGKTSHEQWKKMLSDALAPEVQIVSDRIVIAGLTNEVSGFLEEDPAVTLAAHHELLDIEYDIAGLDNSLPLHAPPRLRHYAVRGGDKVNPSASNSGNVIIPGYLNELLFTRKVCKHWMMYHEYGHHQQLLWQDDSPPTLNEVVVNIYSLAAWRKYKDEPDAEGAEPGGPKLLDPVVWEIVKKYLALPPEQKTFGEYQDENGNAPAHMLMAPFDQLRRGLGSNFIRRWHKCQRENPHTDLTPFGQKIGMILNACRASQLDLSQFFADWGILKSRYSKDKPIWMSIDALNLSPPMEDMTALQPFLPDEK